MGWETLIYYGVVLIAGAFAYSGYQKAQQAAKAAMARQQGLVYQVRSPIASRRIIHGTQRVGGIEAFDSAGTSGGPSPGGGENNLIHFILIWGEGPIKGVRNWQIGGVDVPLVSDGGFGVVWRPVAGSPYEGHLRLEHRLGGDDNSTVLGQGVIAGWGPTDKLTGIAYTWAELLYNPDVYPNGVPQMSAVIEGRNDIYDPRDDTTGFSDNPALCFAHYLSLPRLGCGVDYDNEIGQDELIACANICDEDVDGEPRYTFNGVIQMEDDPEDNIQRFRSAMAGSAVYISGKWLLYAGAYITPTFTITEAMLVGEVSSASKIPLKDHINTVKGLYVGETPSNWQPTDFLPVTQQAYIDADQGREMVDDINLPDTISHNMARRIASIHLERARRPRQISIKCNVEVLRAQPSLPVFFHIPALGYTNQPMDVLEWGLSIEGLAISVTLTLREIDPAIFDAPEVVTPTVYIPPVMPPVYYRRLISFRHERFVAVNSPLFALVAQPDLAAGRFVLSWSETEDGIFRIVRTVDFTGVTTTIRGTFSLPCSLEQSVAAADSTIRVKLLPVAASGADPRRSSALLTDWAGTTSDGAQDRLLLILIAKSGGVITSQEICSVNGAAELVSTDVYDVPVLRGRRWSTAANFNTGSFPDAFASYEVWITQRSDLSPFSQSDWLWINGSRPDIFIRYTPSGLGLTYNGNDAFAEYERRNDASEDLAEFEFQIDETQQPTDPFSWPSFSEENTYDNMMPQFYPAVAYHYQTRQRTIGIYGFPEYDWVFSDVYVPRVLLGREDHVTDLARQCHGVTEPGSPFHVVGYRTKDPATGAVSTVGFMVGPGCTIDSLVITPRVKTYNILSDGGASGCGCASGDTIYETGTGVYTLSDVVTNAQSAARLISGFPIPWEEIAWTLCAGWNCSHSFWNRPYITGSDTQELTLQQGRFRISLSGLPPGSTVIAEVPVYQAEFDSSSYVLDHSDFYSETADGSGNATIIVTLPDVEEKQHAIGEPKFYQLG